MQNEEESPQYDHVGVEAEVVHLDSTGQNNEIDKEDVLDTREYNDLPVITTREHDEVRHFSSTYSHFSLIYHIIAGRS